MTILRPRQKTFVERSIAALNEYGNTLGVAPTGCHAKGTPILMFNGEIKNVEDIEVGEQLMGPDSRPRTVLELHRGQDEMVEICPLNGESFIVNEGHILSLMLDGVVVNISVSDYQKQTILLQRRYQLYRADIDFPEYAKATPSRRYDSWSYFTTHSKGVGDYFGFTVDCDHLYCMGDFTVTHNSGKTIMLSAVTGERLKNTDAKACVLAHRDELTSQNESKFLRVNPSITTSVFDAKQKSWNGQVTFSMVQTLSRESGIKQIPRLDLLVIDEAHHAAADSYRRVIDTVRDKNPSVALYGVTATPNRSDSKGLRDIFSNVADQITLSELIRSGHLVKPITYDIDLGQRAALSQITGSANAVDNATSQLLNTRPTNDAVVKHWREKAGDRQTIVFCSTIEHAKGVAAAFEAAGVATECVHGELSSAERQAALARYESQQSQVVVNVAVLTEGYDYPPTSCVVLLRLSSHKSTFLQMIGRGLRTVNPEEYPGITKSDCILLDFGTSTSSYGRLEVTVDLDGSSAKEKQEAPTKSCPECDALIPAAASSCFLCDHIFTVETKPPIRELDDFVMTEVDLFNQSVFQWCDLFGDSGALMATGFDAWAGLFFLHEQWYAVGGLKKKPPTLLAMGDKLVCLAAADDWLNEHETENAARKSKKWLKQIATPQQLKYLPSQYKHNFGLSRYHASCLLAFQFNKKAIHQCIFRVANRRRAA